MIAILRQQHRASLNSTAIARGSEGAILNNRRNLFMEPFGAASRLASKKRRGVITHALHQALVCPQQNAFSTPEWACFKRRLLLKLPVSM
jgi:hypothetical protein